MPYLLNISGFLLAIVAAVVVLRTWIIWHGILRGSIFSFFLGFLSLGGKFLVDSLDVTYGFFHLSQALAFLGIAFLFWGSRKIFALE